MHKFIKTLGISVAVVVVSILNVAPATFGGIPEPGMILYGKVFDESGTLMTAGELTWTFEPSGGGAPVIVTAPLTEIEGEGGPYSYKVRVTFETAVPSYPVSANAIPLSATPLEYTRTVLLTGTGISRTDTVVISTMSRGSVEQVSIGGVSPEDTDEDGLPDVWEQQIIDADPNDNIAAPVDVLQGADFDGDGESNWEEWQYGSSPISAMSARRGDVDGDKNISILDAIVALKMLCGVDPGVVVSTSGDVNGDGRIGAEEALYVSQKVSTTR